MSENPQETIFRSILQDKEAELKYYLKNMSEDHMEILKQAQPEQIQNFLNRQEDPQRNSFDEEEQKSEGIYALKYQYDEQENTEATTNHDDQSLYTQEVKKDIIKDQNGQDIFKVLYSNGDQYEGEMENDLKEGSGTYYYQNGEKYEGLFQEDMLHGYGKYLFLGGHKYEGDWYEGKKQGFGILIFCSGDKYQGEFMKDTFEGKGTFTHNNGDLFEGKWKKGKKNGSGKFFGQDKRRIFGKWKDDELQHF